MLQVWKIELPADHERPAPIQGWALAETADEAVQLTGQHDAVATQEPERLWIAKERLIWVR